MLNLTILLFSNIVFFFLGVITSVVGFGFNVMGVPYLTALEGAQTAVAVVSIPSFVNTLMIVFQSRKSGRGVISLKESHAFSLLVMAGFGTLLGTFLLVALDPSIVRVCLGVLLVLFVLTNRLRKNWHPDPRHGGTIAIGVGILTGILNGLAGVSGPTLAPYLYTLRLDKYQFVYYINTLFIVLGLFQFISFFSAGLYTVERVIFGLCLIPLSLIGVYIGIKIRSKVNQEFFNRLVLIVLFLTALDLIRRGLHLF